MTSTFTTTTSYTCDGCGRVHARSTDDETRTAWVQTRGSLPPGWFTVSEATPGIGPHEFCSKRCLLTWAKS